MARPCLGDLNRRIQFQRATLNDDGLGVSETWVDHGIRIRAQKRDVSSAEQAQAASVGMTITTRFVVWASSFTRAITAEDRVVCEGVTYDIVGILELAADRRYLQITGAVRV